MATTTLETSARNAACNAVVDLADAGSGAGYVRIRAGSTTLVDIDLNDPAFGDAATGVATADTTGGLSGVAVATGTADNFQVFDSDDTLRWSGDVSTTAAGTGAMQLNNTSIASGQTVTISSFTHTQPA